MDTFKRLPRRAGVTLIEIMFAISIIVVAMIGLIFVISHSTKQNQSNREVALAHRAAQAVLERMSSRTFEDVFKMYNEKPDDGLGIPWYKDSLASRGLENYLSHSQPGPYFDVELDPVSRKPYLRSLEGETFCGKVTFPSKYDSGSNTEPLLEDPADPSGDWKRLFGFPRDLDGDGNVDKGGNDYSSSYRILPVVVTVSWQGLSGVRSIKLQHLFISRKSS